MSSPAREARSGIRTSRAPRWIPALAAAALLALVTAAVAAFNFPQLTGRVVDAANIIPPATRAALETKLATLEDKSGIQLVVATVPSLEGSDIETYSVELARAWKIGEAKKNNGLVLLVAPNERKVRIEVGYGLEGTMTDALSSVIIQSAVIPKFRSGDFAGGIVAGVDAIIDALTVDSQDWQAKARVRVDQQQNSADDILPFLIFAALFIFVVYMMTRNARGGGRWVNNGGRTIFIPMNTGGWSSGSGGFGGFGGGGGFSGGGGSFGGGGASGSW
ncbi:MAG: TPM domain-containing protein [Hyphomicrobiales bacterium]|nr:TPM domain-containing protein [Hyphomicrobiales bacterium]